METVYIVDEDADLRAKLSADVVELGYVNHPFATAANFLDSLHHLPSGAVLVELQIADLSGLDVLAALHDGQPRFAPILMTEVVDVSNVITAMKRGAVDVLCKPFDIAALRPALAGAFAALAAIGPTFPDMAPFASVLTGRQRDVMRCLIEGQSNKEIARQLDISLRTVEMHRASLMARLGVRNLAGLIKKAFHADQIETGASFEYGSERTRSSG